MNFFNPKTIWTIIIATCSLTLCNAQQPQQVTLQFVTFPKWTERVPIQMITGEGETIELTVPSNSFSKPYTVPLLSEWIFGRPKVNEEGKPSFEVFGKGKALTSKNQLVLIIRMGKDPSDGLKVITLDNQLNQFQGGDFFYLNTSSFDVAGLMGKTKFLIKPGEYELVKLKPEDIHIHDEVKFVHTELFYKEGDEANPFFSSTWPANQNARSMIFFYHSGDKRRIRMHTIQDYLPNE